MVDGGIRAAFPVLFFDGEREIDVGDVEICPTLEYKPFQQMLSRMIGISPNQISIYLVNRSRNHKSPLEERRRIPITGKVNFESVCRQKGCSFLAVLKRSRKSKNRRERMAINDADQLSDCSPENEFSPNLAPENLILMRRNQTTSFYHHISQPELEDLNHRLQLRDLNGRLQSLRIQKEKFQMEITKGSVNSPDFCAKPQLDSNAYFDSFPTIEDIYRADSTTKSETRKTFCEECRNAKNGGATSFHHCVNDAVIIGPMTRLGPINRPNKSLP